MSQVKPDVRKLVIRVRAPPPLTDFCHNTPGNEVSPFVFENSLFFASDIFYGLGGMDIYKSELQNDESFSIPVNLGMGLNSEEDDFGFIIKNNKTVKYIF